MLIGTPPPAVTGSVLAARPVEHNAIQHGVLCNFGIFKQPLGFFNIPAIVLI